ncbi:hypothetical protein [Pseudomonas sp. RIT-To-2]
MINKLTKLTVAAVAALAILSTSGCIIFPDHGHGGGGYHHGWYR